MGATMKVSEVAETLGMSPQTIRCWIADGKCPFAFFHKKKYAERGTYIISKQKFEEWFGEDKKRCSALDL